MTEDLNNIDDYIIELLKSITDNNREAVHHKILDYQLHHHTREGT
jgi:hypothetical protein